MNTFVTKILTGKLESRKHQQLSWTNQQPTSHELIYAQMQEINEDRLLDTTKPLIPPLTVNGIVSHYLRRRINWYSNQSCYQSK